MKNISNLETVAALEALLFCHGEPLTISHIATFLGISESACESSVTALTTALEAETARGLTVVRRGETIQLVTKSAYARVIEKVIKDEFRETLTPASLEVLSLVAYFGPISRATVDYIRGVNSSFTMRNLLMRGLIERVDGVRASHGGYEYDITFQCLHHLGVEKREDLPEYEMYRTRFATFDTEHGGDERSVSDSPTIASVENNTTP